MILKKNNIVLLGMTGVGKTTIGKILSKTTMFDFVDVDYEIEKASNMKISDFFIKYNEEDFRKVEKKILVRNLLNKKNTVISTGAGVLSDEEIIKFVKNESISIFLNINLSILIKRLKKNIRGRPLLASGNLEKTLKLMYKDRLEKYNKADIKILVDGLSINEIISKIIEKLNCYEKN